MSAQVCLGRRERLFGVAAPSLGWRLDCGQAALPCSQEPLAQQVKQRYRPGPPPQPWLPPPLHPPSPEALLIPGAPPPPALHVGGEERIAALAPQGSCCRKHPGHQGS